MTDILTIFGAAAIAGFVTVIAAALVLQRRKHAPPVGDAETWELIGQAEKMLEGE